MLEVVSAILEDMGHDVGKRQSAMGASAWIARERPNLVLVDLTMPALPGDEWFDLITNKTLLATDENMPAFVLLSARSIEELERVVRDTCAVGYIQKGDESQDFEAAFNKVAQSLPP